MWKREWKRLDERMKREVRGDEKERRYYGVREWKGEKNRNKEKERYKKS